jgi:hypothetical protein
MKLGFVLSMGLLMAAGASGAESKKLIEFGWDEPGTRFIREHIKEMQQTPFDGCVFHVDYKKKDGSNGRLTWEGWGTNVVAFEDLAEALQDLKSAELGNFKWNFARFNTTPARLDWFDDYGAVIENCRVAARFAREARCPGLLFDIEQYEAPLFDYRKQKYSYDKSKPSENQKSWEVYASQVRKRGQEVMEAFQTSYPDLVIFLTFGYSLPWVESGQGRSPLAECHYGLLAPFLDGIVSAAKGKTRLIDGHEISYGWKTTEQFLKGYKAMSQDLLPIVRDPEKYRNAFSFGFGLWMDQDWRKNGWNPDDASKNYFTPETFGAAVGSALKQADEFVWIYTETPKWWTKEGKPEKLPQAYIDSVKAAKQNTGK